ncbi:hypothetical protein KIPB_015484, partial [Kipferlia bialata]
DAKSRETLLNNRIETLEQRERELTSKLERSQRTIRHLWSGDLRGREDRESVTEAVQLRHTGRGRGGRCRGTGTTGHKTNTRESVRGMDMSSVREWQPRPTKGQGGDRRERHPPSDPKSQTPATVESSPSSEQGMSKATPPDPPE